MLVAEVVTKMHRLADRSDGGSPDGLGLMQRDDLVTRYFKTVWTIAASKHVESYVVGYTSQSALQRFTGYRKLEYDFMVVLADKLTEIEALDLEEAVQGKIKKSDRRLPPWQKYHRIKRLQRHFRSAGPGSPAPLEKIHSVYMAWWGPDE